MRIGACGVCHSDVHLHDGSSTSAAAQDRHSPRILEPPRTLGHEIAGTVVAVGPEAEGVAVGDRRVVYPWIGCGRCAAASAATSSCARPARLGINRDGGFADHVLVPHPRICSPSTRLPRAGLHLACSGLTARRARRVPRRCAGDRF